MLSYYNHKNDLLKKIISELEYAKKSAKKYFKNTEDQSLINLKDAFNKMTGKNGLYTQFANDINIYNNYKKVYEEYFKAGADKDYKNLSKLNKDGVMKDIKHLANKLPKPILRNISTNMNNLNKKREEVLPKLKSNSHEMIKMLNQFGWYFAAWCHLTPLIIKFGPDINAWSGNFETEGPLSQLPDMINKGSRLKDVFAQFGLNSDKGGLDLFDKYKISLDSNKNRDVMLKSFDYFVNKFRELIEIIKTSAAIRS